MFTNDSRWDRHLPSQDKRSVAIEVALICRQGQLFPRWFVWQGRKYLVKEVTYRWQDKKGADVLHYFSVSDGANLFQIYFSTRRLHWRLEKVIPMES